MPAKEPRDYSKELDAVVQEVGTYPVDAYFFLQNGLEFTMNRAHAGTAREGADRHVSGQQLCEGLRDLALAQWGMLARLVLERWNVTSTFDFGRMVYALIARDLLQKTERDSIEDFRNVYDFKSAFDADYRIEIKA